MIGCTFLRRAEIKTGILKKEERTFGRRYGEDQWEINQQPRPARLDFPKFDGDNPTRWIYKVEQFFEHYQTLERRKLKWQHSVWREKH